MRPVSRRCKLGIKTNSHLPDCACGWTENWWVSRELVVLDGEGQARFRVAGGALENQDCVLSPRYLDEFGYVLPNNRPERDSQPEASMRLNSRTWI